MAGVELHNLHHWTTPFICRYPLGDGIEEHIILYHDELQIGYTYTVKFHKIHTKISLKS